MDLSFTTLLQQLLQARNMLCESTLIQVRHISALTLTLFSELQMSALANQKVCSQTNAYLNLYTLNKIRCLFKKIFILYLQTNICSNIHLLMHPIIVFFPYHSYLYRYVIFSPCVLFIYMVSLFLSHLCFQISPSLRPNYFNIQKTLTLSIISNCKKGTENRIIYPAQSSTKHCMERTRCHNLN